MPPAIAGESAVWLASRIPPETRSKRKASKVRPPSIWPGTRFSAWLANAIQRPSALIRGLVEWPLADWRGEPLARLTRDTAPEALSKRKTSTVELVSAKPGTRSVARLANVTKRPSSLISARLENPLPGDEDMPARRLTRVIEPVARCHRKTLSTREGLLCPATRLLAVLTKTTALPSALIRASLELSFAGAPGSPLACETRVLVPAARS